MTETETQREGERDREIQGKSKGGKTKRYGERKRKMEKHKETERRGETQRQSPKGRQKIKTRRQTGQTEVGVIQGGPQGWQKTGCGPDPQYLGGPRRRGEKGEQEPPLPTSLLFSPTHQPSSAHPTTDGETEAGPQASLTLLGQRWARLPRRDQYHQVNNGNGSGFFFFPLRKS